MSWRNLVENSGDQTTTPDDRRWLPETSDYGIADVVCVAGKNPDDEKILGCCHG